MTMGEPGTRRALESMQSQTLALRDVIVIRGVSPFSAALNHAAQSVRTPFFIQVDSDMVLDSDCVERLRHGMSSEVGIAAGLLRDPLMGEVGAVKLFRRACFDAVRLHATVSTDVDFYLELAERGWLTLYVLGEARPGRTRTLGEHRPVYSASYTYATYYLLGARCWRLRDLTSLRWRLHKLRASRHWVAPLARVALAHGLFSDEARDVTKGSVPIERAVLRQLSRPENGAEPSLPPLPTGLPIGALCDLFYEQGRSLGSRGAYAALRSRLNDTSADGDPWPLEISLSHGFLSAAEGKGASASIWQRLRQLG